MTDKELTKLKKQLKKQIKIVKNDSKKARQLLIDTGIYTKTGRLKKLYK
jgi:hypothetical protein